MGSVLGGGNSDSSYKVKRKMLLDLKMLCSKAVDTDMFRTLLDTLLIIEKKEKLRQTWRTQKNGLEILKKTISIQVLSS